MSLPLTSASGARRLLHGAVGGPVLVTLAAFAAVAATAAVNGAYFPTSWGWAGLGFGWTALCGLLLRNRVRLGALDLTIVFALWSLLAWTALSSLWSLQSPRSLLEVERTLVYAAAVTAVVVLVSSRVAPGFLAGIATAITSVCAYSLATRLFPRTFGFIVDPGVNRLERPLGYWNALGAFAAMGCLLVFGLATRSRTVAARAAAAAALPLLAVTLYLTFSRGAWYALVGGIAVLLALERRRLETIASLALLGPWAAAAVWIASRQDALTSREPVLADAASQGRFLTPVLVGLCLGAGATGLGIALAERRLPPLGRARPALGALVALAAAGGALAVFLSYGAPWTLVERGYNAFTKTPKASQVSPAAAADLNRRLFSLWGNGRADYWHAAWREADEDLLIGSGAGTFEGYWLRSRPFPGQVRDAHGLYIETLAELGIVGLALLVVILAAPLAAAVRARAIPSVPAVAGAYVVYVLHAGVDWDWEVVAVTLTGLLLGGALLGLARRPNEGRLLRIRGRLPLVAVVLAATSFAFVGLVGNTALSSSTRAAAKEDWPRAESEARKATRWAPWSSAGWEALGLAQLQAAKLAEARRSFRKALTYDSRDWELWLDLAFASSGRERRDAARRALELNPLSPEIAGIKPALGLG